jgi:hypothetical protein
LRFSDSKMISFSVLIVVEVISLFFIWSIYYNQARNYLPTYHNDIRYILDFLLYFSISVLKYWLALLFRGVNISS